MDTRCQICGEATDILTLTTACRMGEERVLTVCRTCLDRRDARRWSADNPTGRRLRDALETSHPAHPHGRYTYLADARGNLHLVRLKHGWLDQHAAPVGTA